MDNRTFANQFLEPKRTGNAVKDLNPLSKLNIFIVLGLSAFFAEITVTASVWLYCFLL